MTDHDLILWLFPLFIGMAVFGATFLLGLVIMEQMKIRYRIKNWIKDGNQKTVD